MAESKNTFHFLVGEERISAEAQGTILDAARSKGIFIEAPCGGEGTCGKCRVEVDGKLKFACQEKALAGQEVVLIEGLEGELSQLDDYLSNWRDGGIFCGAERALAIDVGTSNIEIAVLDAVQGMVLGGATAPNRQRILGADVLTRIISAEREPEVHHRLVRLLRDSINHIAQRALQDAGLRTQDIGAIAVSANTVLAHFLLNQPPTRIRYQPAADYSAVGGEFRSDEMGILGFGDTPTYLLPPISGYVGGDIVAGLVALRVGESEPAVLIDGGTNGEVSAVVDGAVVALATSAGPAFEGGETACGIPARKGAISSISLKDDLKPSYQTIRGAKPEGICGSGLIQLLACLLELGVIEQDGGMRPDGSSRFRKTASEGTAFIVVNSQESGSGLPIYISEVDIKNIIRTKAAIQAGLLTAVERIGLSLAEVRKLYLSGNFGSRIDLEAAKGIGLLPRLPAGEVVQPKNSSLLGACAAILSENFRRKALELSRSAAFIDLSEDQRFIEHFTASSFLPHTDLNWDL